MSAGGTKQNEGTRVRAKGSGGIIDLGEGKWKIDIEIGRDPITKRRRRVARHVLGTREDAEIALARLRVADHEKRLQGGTRARSAGAALDQYIREVESGFSELEPQTIVTCRSAAKKMRTTELADGRMFGSILLSRLNWRDVEALYEAMRSSGSGADWVRRSATVLTQALELARRKGLVSSNPAKDAMRPKSRKQKPFSPAVDDVRSLLASVANSDPEIGTGAALLIATGMRRGELLALRWSDINWAHEELHVNKSLSDGGRGVGIVVKSTKRSDWRDVPLTKSALNALRKHRDQLPEPRPTDLADRFVFTIDPLGKTPMRPDRFTDRWDVARGASTVKLQELRHFAATSMLDAGESYRTVAEILGNSENTLRLHYDGRTDVGKRKAVQALEFD
jgi:integrase